MIAKTDLNAAVSQFGDRATGKLSSPAAVGQPEDQLRAPLENLLPHLAELAGLPSASLKMIGETSLAELKTRPDYSVSMHNALCGFIEVKAPGKGADPRNFTDQHDKEQWSKLKSLPNLLYTDGNAFSVWRSGSLEGEIVHLDGDVRHSGKALSAPDKLIPLIGDFLTWNPIPPESAPALAEVAARLCRFLRDEVVEEMERDNAPLKELAKDWRALLFPRASDAQFADGFAQAVTFGLLMARFQDIDLAQDLDRVGKKLGQDTLIGAALRLLTDSGEDLLQTSLKTLARVLNEVNWAKISKGNPEAWLYFYEDFLAVYDQTLRRKTGSYYTPPEVVEAMVRLSEEALKDKNRFDIPEGLASDKVVVADPAMGSGTFLLGVLRRIAKYWDGKDGAGNSGPHLAKAASRLIGFELQFGAFAVAQLRLAAELGNQAEPKLFLTNTLGNPFAEEERFEGYLKVFGKSRAEANRIKAKQPITLVIGNPPYKEKAKGRGGWIEDGSGNDAAPYQDWVPPPEWGVGAHSKHLRNLYVYFWRWAAWKVFGPPLEEKRDQTGGDAAGMVCFITVSGFLNGPGFQKMRDDLRRRCDAIWVIDCSPEGHQPQVSTRIFQGVQHPVCIVIAARSPETDESEPADVRFRALAPGPRGEKFIELAGITLKDDAWETCPSDWRGPFLPEFGDGWGDYPALDSLIGDSGSGVMPGRTWVIAPDKETLEQRWDRLLTQNDAAKRADWFHPHLRGGKPGDKHIDKATSSGLGARPKPLGSVNHQITLAKDEPELSKIVEPVRYGFRSFDRQWAIPDNRLINQPNPGLWGGYSVDQIYFSALMAHIPTAGPALTFTSLVPDLHQYKGSFGGRVFALWQDAAATKPNMPKAVLDLIEASTGKPVPGPDLMAYIAAIAAHPAYTARFQDDLVRPGLRIPLTADGDLFDEAVKIGRKVIWLHTYGERFGDAKAGRPSGEPRLAKNPPAMPKDGAIPAGSFPDTLHYDAATKRLHIGGGHIDHVPPAVMDYQVSGKYVVRQWFSYRKKDRSRPVIGDRRPASPLGAIQPDHWLPEYTSELINLLNVLAMLVEIEPDQADLLKRVCDGSLVSASDISTAILEEEGAED